MCKSAYIVISDLHLSDVNLRGRYNYPKEVSQVISKITEIANAYKSNGYAKVYAILLGDVANRSYKSLTEGIYFNNIFVWLDIVFDRIYCVIGNHELSFYTDNPFWTLMQTIDSPKIERIKAKTWEPKGFIQLVNVVDRLEDGNVVFHFNHHSTSISPSEENKINIGLFHQDIVAKAIIDEMKQVYDSDIFEAKPKYFDESSILYGYDYAFFGHMHKVYGKWTYICDRTKYETQLIYLASLGRTNHTEVSDNFLERNIPAVIIEDGIFIGIEDNKFNLLTRAETVKEEIVKVNKEEYERKKEIKYIVENIPDLDEPMTNIESHLASNPDLFELFSEYRKDGHSIIETLLINKMEDVLR